MQLTSDLTIYSLLAYFGSTQWDWQIETKRYESSVGIFENWKGASKPNDCRIVDQRELRDLLKASQNAFADMPRLILRDSLCLPPNTEVVIDRNRLAFKNPFCRMSFEVEIPGTVSNVKPRSSGEMPMLSTGRPRYKTRPVGIRVSVHYVGLRAPHIDASKYHAWVDRVIARAHTWFEARET